MNAIPYFDYSMAPFWPSYQNKIVGVLNRALREQSCSRVRRILLRLPWEHDNAFNSRQTWFGMDFIDNLYNSFFTDKVVLWDESVKKVKWIYEK